MRNALCLRHLSPSMEPADAHDGRYGAGPRNSYGIAKLAIEQELRVSMNVWLRLHHLPSAQCMVNAEHRDRYRNVVGIFMNQILKGQPMTIFGDGSRRGIYPYQRRGTNDR